MREHAIPQDVVGYRFHIIGNMTLKQFLEVGAGCVVGVLIYATNLHPIIKWPFIGLSVAIGAMAAFVPFEERPFDHWLVTFAKVLYKPTKFFWKKDPKIPDPFLYTPATEIDTTIELDLSPARRQRIKEYLTSVTAPTLLDPAELAEQQRMAGILASFQTVQVTQVTRTMTIQKPSLSQKPHNLKKPLDQQSTTQLTTTTVRQLEETVEMSMPVYQFNKPALDVSAVAQQIQIPELEAVDIDSTQTVSEQSVTQTDTVNNATFTDNTTTPQLLSTATPITATQSITMNTELPFPTKPTEPNKIVGMVLSPTNDLINDAIVEIQSDQGSVVRAVKSNALGQFFISTPLANGRYTVLVEKDGFSFTPLNLEVTGSVVEPVEIRST